MANHSSPEDVCTNQAPNQEDPWSIKHVLTLDGGGVRGYFSLLCIKRLMDDIVLEERRRDEVDPLGGGAERITSFYPCQEPSNVSHLETYTQFLPCHYFDYIAGTSTGGLIAIMLGRFRMSVDDCIHEYQHLAGKIFGHPRPLHSMNTFGLVRVCKYSTRNFKKIIKRVVGRREDLNRHWNPQGAKFDIENGLCRVFVVANRTGPSGTVIAPWIFRSYEMRANRGGRPGDICVWQVARATTAAPLYFKPYELKTNGDLDGIIGRPPFHRDRTTGNSTNHRETTGPPVVRLEDGGFGTANNPSKYMLDELNEELPEGRKVGTFVSIGTARPTETATGLPLLRLIRGAIHRLSDPEGTHEYMMQQAANPNAPFSYYRLNSPGMLNSVKMDDWKPRATGEDTMMMMNAAFFNYASQSEISDSFRECAKKLVQARRARVRADRSMWDRFALGRYFRCGRCPDEFRRETNEANFRAHLRDSHGISDNEIENALNECKYQWNYRGVAILEDEL